jgi:acetolactate synthase-1/2/3 large subunit
VVIDEGVSTGRGMAGAMGGGAARLAGRDGRRHRLGPARRRGRGAGAPGRPVLALEGDGSAMYTVQALWTLAREQLPVVVLVFANRAYRILQGELQGVGATISGQKAADMLSLDRPALDWVSMARGHGLPGVRVDTAEGLVKALRDGFASRAPCVIEAVL